MTSSLTNEIKEKLDIVEVIGSYIKIEKSGQNYKARCPFHNEKTPSFFISPKRNSFYCFGCGAKGDIFSFVEQIENVDFLGALKMLAEKAGVQIRYEKDAHKDEKERLFECMDKAGAIFEENLKKNVEALNYLKNRGLKDETIKSWRIGFAKDAWHDIEERLKPVGFSQKEMLNCGLIKHSESQKIYDTFRNRIMFPIFDSVGRIIAFSGRIFGDEKDVAKYLNSPETEIFKKSEVLYGLNVAKNGIRKMNFSILVEGQMDMLMCHQAGWENTVATSGTALTPEHLNILKRASPNIIISYDNDKAGMRASQKAFNMALNIGFNVKAVRIGDGKDPADVIAKDPNIWKEAIKNACHIVEYSWKNLLDLKLPRDKFVAKFRTDILPMLASVPEQSEKVRLISEYKMSLETGIREEHILEECQKVSIKEEEGGDNFKKETLIKDIKKDTPLRRVLSILFSIEKGTISGRDVKLLIEKIEAITKDSISNLKDLYKLETDRLMFEAEAIYGKTVSEEELDELLINLEEDNLREELSKKMKELKVSEMNKDEVKTKKLLEECQNIMKIIATIKDRPK